MPEPAPMITAFFCMRDLWLDGHAATLADPPPRLDRWQPLPTKPLAAAPQSGARMRLQVDGEQAVAIDLGIDLRRRQAGVAEQFLDLPQVGAGRQQMRGEGMPERVRCGSVRQGQAGAQVLDQKLHDTGPERAAFGARSEEH